MRSAVRSWTSTSLNSVIDAESIFVSISQEERRPAPNAIPIILGIIIAKLVWMISFFAGIVANIEQKEVGLALRIIFVKSAEPCAILQSN